MANRRSKGHPDVLDALRPTANATGELNATNETWYLDYSSSAFTAGWIDIHLEGTAHAASTP